MVFVSEKKLSLPPTHPLFLEHYLSAQCEKEADKEEDILELAEEVHLSLGFNLAPFQQDCRFRALRRARFVAMHLIDEKGQVVKNRLSKVLALLGQLHIPYSDTDFDYWAVRHMRYVLMEVEKNQEVCRLLHRFFSITKNTYVSQLVEFSLLFEKGKRLMPYHTTQAVFSALLAPLRQSLGSCFATAPAIFIQSEQIGSMLQDLYDLLTTYRLRRVIEGEEHTVPMSPNFGVGDLKKPIFITKEVFLVPSIQMALHDLGIRSLRSFPFSHSVSTVEALMQFFSQTKIGKRKPTKAQMERALHLIVSYIDHPMLKMWEYTLASFADHKVDFYKWNLHASLGFDPKLSSGIGEVIWNHLQSLLEESNQKITDLQKECELSFDRVRMTQALLRSADSESKVRRLKGELQIYLHELETHQTLRDECIHMSEHLSSFFKFLIEEYSHHFPLYFQEVYDPELFEETGALYDDCPAGFRLMYKHGRSDPSLWTPIQNENQFSDCLVQFFRAMESLLINRAKWERGKEEIVHITSKVMLHVRTQEFISSALHRSQVLSLENDPHKKTKTPWSYLSGGTLGNLVQCYVARAFKLTEESRAIDSPTDLFVFLLEVMKELPSNICETFVANPHKTLLMYSPNHAFRLLPGLAPFCDFWKERGFSYTYIRDRFFSPSKEFFASMLLSQEQQKACFHWFLNQYFSQKQVDILYSALPLSIQEMGELMMEALGQSNDQIKERLNQFFATAFSLLSAKEMKMHALSFFQRVYQEEKLWQQAYDVFTKELLLKQDLLPFSLLYRLLKVAVIRQQKRYLLPFDIETPLLQATEEIMPPRAVVFADTNWQDQFFGFRVNPLDLKLGLWRTNFSGREGVPMLQWRSSFGSQKRWGVYVRPQEYLGRGLMTSSLLRV